MVDPRPSPELVTKESYMSVLSRRRQDERKKRIEKCKSVRSDHTETKALPEEKKAAQPKPQRRTEKVPASMLERED